MFDFLLRHFLGLHRKLNMILENQRVIIMPTLDELGTEMKNVRTLAEGMKVMVEGLETQIADLNLNLSSSEQAKVDAIFEDAKAASGALTRNQIANTPAAGVDPTAPG